jgi:two-component system NtrC family response regulator
VPSALRDERTTVSQNKPKLLIIEDDPGLQKQLRWSFDAYDVVVADDRESALAQIRRHEPDGSTEGLATLQQILALAPETRVIVLTGNQDRANAVKAIALGAYDFHQKPPEPEVLNLVIQRAFFLHNLQEENRRMSSSQADSPMAGVISRDPGMLKLCRSIEKVAPTSASVMLLGESGTGKEVLARAVHAISPRAKERFVAINCAAIPENLLESELFGYEKGAFTGAAKQTKGKVELMKWVTCRWRCRPSCCASCRSG